MNLGEYRRLLPRQLAIIDALKSSSRSQVEIIDALRSGARLIEMNLSLAEGFEEHIRALWQQQDDLQALFASVVVEQRQQPGCEDTAEIDLVEISGDEPRALPS